MTCTCVILYIRLLWLVVNIFVLALLLRAVYGPINDKSSNQIMAWYFYVVSIITDLLSLIVFGSDNTNKYNYNHGGRMFVLIMSIFLFIPKIPFSYFLYQSLVAKGFSIKNGLSNFDHQSLVPGEEINKGNGTYESPLNNDPGVVVDDNENIDIKHSDNNNELFSDFGLNKNNENNNNPDEQNQYPNLNEPTKDSNV